MKFNRFVYGRNSERLGKTYWICIHAKKAKCKARAISDNWDVLTKNEHSHDVFL